MNIRKYYTPIQPAVKMNAGDVSYAEFLPDVKLQPYIYCYWQLRRTTSLPRIFTYRVVADGCTDIFFDQQNSANCQLIGFCNQFTQFPLEGKFCYTGIRFFPSMISQMFGIDARPLSNKITMLNDILPDLAAFITQHMRSDIDHQQITQSLNQYFLQFLSAKAPDFDRRFYDAMELILSYHGNINIDTELDTGISSRQLRRLFEYLIGTNAKSFARVLRFQAILKATQSGKSAREIFLNMGYYDQSHFIKEFKKLYGLTPFNAIRR